MNVSHFGSSNGTLAISFNVSVTSPVLSAACVQFSGTVLIHGAPSLSKSPGLSPKKPLRLLVAFIAYVLAAFLIASSLMIKSS